MLLMCNKCGKDYGHEWQNEDLYFANCGHLVCSKCQADQLSCPVCNKESNFVKMNNLNESLKLFFEEPSSNIKLYAKIIEFQNLQNNLVQNHLKDQKKKLNDKLNLMEKELKEKTKELLHYKGRCSDLELELEKRNKQVRALAQVDEKHLIKKKTTNEENKKFEFKPDEVKSTFFDVSQIKQKNNVNNNKSPYQETIGRNSLPNYSTHSPVNQNYLNRNRNKKITYDNLDYFLK